MYKITVNELIGIIRSKNWVNHAHNDFVCLVSSAALINDEIVNKLNGINDIDKYLCVLPDNFDEPLMDIIDGLRKVCTKNDVINIPFVISSKTTVTGLKMRTYVIDSNSVIDKLIAFFNK